MSVSASAILRQLRIFAAELAGKGSRYPRPENPDPGHPPFQCTSDPCLRLHCFKAQYLVRDVAVIERFCKGAGYRIQREVRHNGKFLRGSSAVSNDQKPNFFCNFFVAVDLFSFLVDNLLEVLGG